jgi:hypothetical protein
MAIWYYFCMDNYWMNQPNLFENALLRNEISSLSRAFGSVGNISAGVEALNNGFAGTKTAMERFNDIGMAHRNLPKFTPDFSEIVKITEQVPESMKLAMGSSYIIAHQQGLLEEQLSNLSASNILLDTSKLIENLNKIYETNKVITKNLQVKIEELSVDDSSIASQDECHEESNLEEISVPEEISIEDHDDGYLEQHSLPESEDLLQMCQVSIDLQSRILSELQKKNIDWNLIIGGLTLLLTIIQTVKAFFS